MPNKQKDNEVSITSDEITLGFGDIEPVSISRTSLRTRLQLIEWVYRLTGWPGMSVKALRAFITAVFQTHGWAIPESEDDSRCETSRAAEAAPHLEDPARA